MNHTAPCRRALLALLLLPLLMGCPDSAGSGTSLTVVNATQSFSFVPYVVVNTPPPPHREADPAGTLAPGGTYAVDLGGFNPIFFDETRKNGIVLQLDLGGTPSAILVRLFDYQVPPGDEGTDPALQPTLLDERLFEATKSQLTLTIQGGGDFPVKFSEQ